MIYFKKSNGYMCSLVFFLSKPTIFGRVIANKA
jgi:hypothetical protein